jgi:tryptophan-rich sensory protein
MSEEPLGTNTDKSNTVYCVPRRYDLATLMTVSVFFAVLFSTLKMLRSPPLFIGFLSGFVASVGLAQAILFDGRAPRRSSVIAGITYGAAVEVLFIWWRKYPVVFGELLFYLVWHGVTGYFVGALVGGLFLVADYVRRLLHWWKRSADANSNR